MNRLSCCLACLTVLSLPLWVSAQESDRPADPQRARRERPADEPNRPGAGNLMAALPIFTALDANGDGEISKDEIENAAAALKKLDRNNDGKLTRDELMPRRPGGPGGRPADGAARGNAEQFLARMRQADANGDGKLSKDEVPERLQRMFEVGDTNGDGFLDREELAKAAERLRNRAGVSRPEGGERPARPNRPQNDNN